MSAFRAVRAPSGWIVRKDGQDTALSEPTSRLKAWRECRRLARGAEVEAILEDRHGRIAVRNNYSEVKADE